MRKSGLEVESTLNKPITGAHLACWPIDGSKCLREIRHAHLLTKHDACSTKKKDRVYAYRNEAKTPRIMALCC